MEILNDVEKAAVTQFVEFETMREAVKKVLLFSLYTSGTFKPGEKVDPLQNLSLVFVSQHLDSKDEVLGANLRALYHGINALVVGFNKLDEFEKVDDKQHKPNKAR